jgi:hypothetical protein
MKKAKKREATKKTKRNLSLLPCLLNGEFVTVRITIVKEASLPSGHRNT